MMTLLRVVASADWKGRPGVSVVVIGKSDDRDELLRLQDADVAAIQAEELEESQQEENETAEEEGRDPVVPVAWEVKGERWEMKIPLGEDGKRPLRELVYDDGGEFSSVTYHILDGQSAPGAMESI